ncbi:MAG: 4Fe-4S dicluster domain-containing protein [Dehalococcoidia bacterium]|nr:MAG: 4Fe-4S dicluster domain-containing protein [Dehalococcoidia bacterium]
MAAYRFEESQLDPFISAVAKRYHLFAPVRTDAVRFQEVSDGEAIDLSENSYLPIKEFFFAKQHVLFAFHGANLTLPIDLVEPRVFFGVRRCDLNALAHQDLVFMQEPGDPHYAQRREASVLIGYHCLEPPSPHCFCSSMNLQDCQDLMFVPREGYFLVEEGSERGKRLIHDFPRYFRETEEALREEDRRTPGADGLATTDIAALYDEEGWGERARDCLSCGACTVLCPTCYCYEIHDEVELADVHRGSRNRCWSSCQLKEFSRVAGDQCFRESRSDRFRHRIYHQLEYFRERYNVTLCTGCGRCISYCPTRIDWVDMINRMVASAS